MRFQMNMVPRQVREYFGTSLQYFIFLGNIFAPNHDGLVHFLPHDVSFSRGEASHKCKQPEPLIEYNVGYMYFFSYKTMEVLLQDTCVLKILYLFCLFSFLMKMREFALWDLIIYSAQINVNSKSKVVR